MISFIGIGQNRQIHRDGVISSVLMLRWGSGWHREKGWEEEKQRVTVNEYEFLFEVMRMSWNYVVVMIDNSIIH